ncbi:hypothetical protein CIPAW_02G059400 [Carya illinoinensis]|uniref:Glycosyltransferase n=1 Tax=Carya illinoinensis TaxID=32201 RepID=A0A8T1RBJ2_CARIL|nr:hypothetical protein CIPAW_02G059400 [Carya illinoinensis]
MNSQEHIIMLPFLAHGHLIPFLALAKQLQQRTGYTITIASTKLNIQYLRSSISADSDSKILFAELPFCSSAHDLPPNTESTENLSLDRMIKLLYASQSLEDPLFRLLNDIIDQEGRPPLCIISDLFFGWAVDVAKSVGTVTVSFNTGGAYGVLAYVSFCLNLPHRSTDSDEFLVPGFPESVRFHHSQLHPYLRAADGTDMGSKFMQSQFSRCLESSGWLCNSVEEIEPLGLDLLMKYIRLPVWAIGPLLPPAALKSSSSSQNTIGASQMMQLAIGLEGSGKSFIWVVRPPLGFDLNGEFRAEWLPEGFEERMKQSRRGLIVRNWAPQLDILSHKSTGAFLSHCGWNSVLESLSQGVPIVGWPMAAEQAFNSKMLMEEMGVSVELTRGIQRVIEAKEVKRVLESAMDEHGKGEDMRKKATEVKELMKLAVREEGQEKGSSLKAVDEFVRTVLYKRRAAMMADRCSKISAKSD